MIGILIRLSRESVPSPVVKGMSRFGIRLIKLWSSSQKTSSTMDWACRVWPSIAMTTTLSEVLLNRTAGSLGETGSPEIKALWLRLFNAMVTAWNRELFCVLQWYIQQDAPSETLEYIDCRSWVGVLRKDNMNPQSQNMHMGNGYQYPGQLSRSNWLHMELGYYV